MFNKDEVKKMLDEKLFEEFEKDCKKITKYNESNIETLHSILNNGKYYCRFSNIILTIDNNHDLFKNQADVDKYFREIFDVFVNSTFEVFCERSSSQFSFIEEVTAGRSETDEIKQIVVMFNFQLSKIIKQHLKDNGFWEQVPHI